MVLQRKRGRRFIFHPSSTGGLIIILEALQGRRLLGADSPRGSPRIRGPRIEPRISPAY